MGKNDTWNREGKGEKKVTYIENMCYMDEIINNRNVTIKCGMCNLD